MSEGESSRTCGVINREQMVRRTCVLPLNHRGQHQSENGDKWGYLCCGGRTSHRLDCNNAKGETVKTSFVVTGQHYLVTEGIKALESLESNVEGMFTDGEAAEILIYENMPIRALVVEEYGTTWIEWNGERWIESEER